MNFEIKCTKYSPYMKGLLLGFADLYIGIWDVDICSCTLYQQDGKRWVTFPSKDYTNSQGKKIFTPFLKFRESYKMQAFITQSKKAIDMWRDKREKEYHEQKAECTLRP